MAAASEKPTDDLAEISRLGWPTIGDPPRTTVDHAALPSLAPGRPDTVIDFTTVGELTVRAASVRGTSNRYYGEPSAGMTVIGQGSFKRVLCQRRLHRGHFTWPAASVPTCELSEAQWQWLVCGVDWQRLEAPPPAHWRV